MTLNSRYHVVALVGLHYFFVFELFNSLGIYQCISKFSIYSSGLNLQRHSTYAFQIRHFDFIQYISSILYTYTRHIVIDRVMTATID